MRGSWFQYHQSYDPTMVLQRTENKGIQEHRSWGSYQGHAERATHDSMEEVVCSRARHNKEFTDEKIFTAGIV